jgi:uncharacterized membrane protein HdeD (DUF308 family)
MSDSFARVWWMLALRGAVGLLFALVAMAWPMTTLGELLRVFAVYAIIDGAFGIVAGLLRQQRRYPFWPLGLEGGLGIALGAAILAFPSAGAFLLASFLTLWAMITGALEFIAAVRVPGRDDGGLLFVAAGAASFALGLVLVFWPHASVATLAWAMGLYAGLFGLALMALAARLRRTLRRDHGDGMARWAALFVVAAATTMLSCGHSSSTVRPEELSAEGHRSEAKKERMLAEEDYARYQPRASGPLPGGVGGTTDTPRVYPVDTFPYNPTERALAQAETHLRHAREHEEAAGKLEAYEEAECKSFQPKMRAACPLLGPVQKIEDLADGVRITLADGVPLAPVLAEMRCHLAFARARNFEGAPDCPLYLRGVEIAPSANDTAIEVRSKSPAVARTIREQSHQLTTIH